MKENYSVGSGGSQIEKASTRQVRNLSRQLLPLAGFKKTPLFLGRFPKKGTRLSPRQLFLAPIMCVGVPRRFLHPARSRNCPKAFSHLARSRLFNHDSWSQVTAVIIGGRSGSVQNICAGTRAY
ncbi:MAG: hypothetical protein A3F82_10800 [Deltaproteobacteria bacterium RIFCSPLOWO2_12_FULL_44_12]|nr:MAG: hypothetical protein A2712_08805 [Deltaproteobacteria bacterium RIFCSPHIGHO2_01_FULL_43_49]OGQ14564.1 MAG: hypothetical protein A3D22_08195 [Deltaproteobacteria bacterium RIFCSPHIGHO2_02_FULL_44_53]OGQ27950.1 MAG: hypothetical protein A3D98_06905 [Deltaproteobacteria bacterium RIFCSPHIGHO2_12_FULL_44_21]OGQ31162.1 MAG: hypothetical protein A2979_06955 [Deltaproteobacteria bacterium RIFCSPLOWO2_01_FULL_45_74]OGQ43154.1 MAG: hypothetical protein A3I70_00615 [Deltaproteobacteria bacterium 